LQRHAVAAQVHAVVHLQEHREEVLDDRVVEVFAAEERVTGGRATRKIALGELEDRDVERAGREVVDGDALGALGLDAYASAAAVGSLTIRSTLSRRSGRRPWSPGAERRRSTPGPSPRPR